MRVDEGAETAREAALAEEAVGDRVFTDAGETICENGGVRTEKGEAKGNRQTFFGGRVLEVDVDGGSELQSPNSVREREKEEMESAHLERRVANELERLIVHTSGAEGRSQRFGKERSCNSGKAETVCGLLREELTDEEVLE